MQIKNKINKFLIVSVFVVILTCVVVFGVLIQSTNRKNAEMIGNIGSIYMEGMNKRIAAHFETIFSLKRSSAEEIVALDPPESFSDYDSAAATLAYSAKASEFTSFGFLCDDDIISVYGPDASLVLPDLIHNEIESSRSAVTTGRTEDGEYRVIIVVPANYKMADGRVSDAILVGVSVDFVKQVLSLEYNDDSLVYSQLIRNDGSFVLKDDQDYDNYFDRFMDKALEFDGKMPADYISEMKTAIAAHTERFRVQDICILRRCRERHGTLSLSCLTER